MGVLEAGSGHISLDFSAHHMAGLSLSSLSQVSTKGQLTGPVWLRKGISTGLTAGTGDELFSKEKGESDRCSEGICHHCRLASSRGKQS